MCGFEGERVQRLTEEKTMIIALLNNLPEATEERKREADPMVEIRREEGEVLKGILTGRALDLWVFMKTSVVVDLDYKLADALTSTGSAVRSKQKQEVQAAVTASIELQQIGWRLWTMQEVFRTEVREALNIPNDQSVGVRIGFQVVAYSGPEKPDDELIVSQIAWITS